jgi:hypothetical protein
LADVIVGVAQLSTLGIMDTTTKEDEPLTDTLKPIYARFVFEQHQQALAFAELIVERGWTVSVDYAPERAHWQATVRRQICPVFRDITIWLVTLTARATPLGGESDGWGHE